LGIHEWALVIDFSAGMIGIPSEAAEHFDVPKVGRFELTGR
jgi:hypothetical protein